MGAGGGGGRRGGGGGGEEKQMPGKVTRWCGGLRFLPGWERAGYRWSRRRRGELERRRGRVEKRKRGGAVSLTTSPIAVFHYGSITFFLTCSKFHNPSSHFRPLQASTPRMWPPKPPVKPAVAEGPSRWHQTFVSPIYMFYLTAQTMLHQWSDLLLGTVE